MKLSDFNYDLPGELIANSPVIPRHNAKMFVNLLGQTLHKKVLDLPDFLTPKDLIIFNNSKVIPAKIEGITSGRKISVNLNKEIKPSKWLVFIKPAKKAHVNDIIHFGDDFFAEILEKGEFGEFTIKFNVKNLEFYGKLSEFGKMPIPPYISPDPLENHNQTYQTIFAKHEGSVAAPTAGLHFTNELFQKLEDKNIQHNFVTLHVGAGTFLPVRSENISKHKMHSEFCEITQEVADQINETKSNGGRVIAVGTTSLRILESAANEKNEVSTFKGETNIFITPGYKFKVIDMLMTNFHLPKSTLLMLVSAFCGFKETQNMYREAIEKEYRFFSYGDCSLLELLK